MDSKRWRGGVSDGGGEGGEGVEAEVEIWGQRKRGRGRLEASEGREKVIVWSILKLYYTSLKVEMRCIKNNRTTWLSRVCV